MCYLVKSRPYVNFRLFSAKHNILLLPNQPMGKEHKRKGRRIGASFLSDPVYPGFTSLDCTVILHGRFAKGHHVTNNMVFRYFQLNK